MLLGQGGDGRGKAGWTFSSPDKYELLYNTNNLGKLFKRKLEIIPKISEEYTPLDSIGFSKSLGGDFHQFGYDYPSLSEDLLQFRRVISHETRSIFLSEKIDLASMLEIIL